MNIPTDQLEAILAKAPPAGDQVLKFIYCVRKRAELSDEEFKDYWLNNHGPLVKKYADALSASRYIQSHRLDTPLNDAARGVRGCAEPYDGLTELWWQNADDLVAVLSSEEGQQINGLLKEDEARFVDLERSSVFFAVEHVIF